MIFSKMVMTFLKLGSVRNRSQCKSAQSDVDSNMKSWMQKGSLQRSEQSNRGKSVAAINFSRTKQTISSRNASQARVHIFTPRRCFTHDCNEQSCRLSAPVSISALIRFSKRSKNASSYPAPASCAISTNEMEMGGGEGTKCGPISL